MRHAVMAAGRAIEDREVAVRPVPARQALASVTGEP
jgi:hypothetical protein